MYFSVVVIVFTLKVHEGVKKLCPQRPYKVPPNTTECLEYQTPTVTNENSFDLDFINDVIVSFTLAKQQCQDRYYYVCSFCSGHYS